MNECIDCTYLLTIPYKTAVMNESIDCTYLLTIPHKKLFDDAFDKWPVGRHWMRCHVAILMIKCQPY